MHDQDTELIWRHNDLPVSSRFDDPYFSSHDGRAETRHVFIEGNRLPERWPQMTECTIAELGFGTGLNFLETVSIWQRHAPETAHLNFISFERFPLRAKEMQRALSRWPELANFARRLIQSWKSGTSIFEIELVDRVRLTVHFGDANDRLPNQKLEVDAWYLDGFAPARNPELWNAKLMNEVYQSTVPGGTFATYSAAGFVRRNLTAAGFEVSKRTGFANKREMLVGERRH